MLSVSQHARDKNKISYIEVATQKKRKKAASPVPHWTARGGVASEVPSVVQIGRLLGDDGFASAWTPQPSAARCRHKGPGCAVKRSFHRFPMRRLVTQMSSLVPRTPARRAAEAEKTLPRAHARSPRRRITQCTGIYALAGPIKCHPFIT